MPTGFTDAIKDDITFKQFVFRCAHAFIGRMKDDSCDTDIPEKFKPSDYYLKKLNELKNELNRLEGISILDAEKGAEQDFINLTKQNRDFLKEKDELKIKYVSMLKQVKKWNPPTKNHSNLKNFMIDQIEKSIDFDCGDYSGVLEQPILLSPEEWKNNQIQKVKRDIDYYAKEYQKECDRIDDLNDWIKQLRESLE